MTRDYRENRWNPIISCHHWGIFNSTSRMTEHFLLFLNAGKLLNIKPIHKTLICKRLIPCQVVHCHYYMLASFQQSLANLIHMLWLCTTSNSYWQRFVFLTFVTDNWRKGRFNFSPVYIVMVPASPLITETKADVLSAATLLARGLTVNNWKSTVLELNNFFPPQNSMEYGAHFYQIIITEQISTLFLTEPSHPGKTCNKCVMSQSCITHHWSNRWWLSDVFFLFFHLYVMIYLCYILFW